MQASERRNHTRQPFSADITFSVTDSGPLSAAVIDISESGIGLSTDRLLKVGQQVNFSKNQTGWELPAAGMVMWAFKAPDGCRVGVKFA